MITAHFSRRTRAFTLIELLVVVSIIAILAALLMPVLGSVREKGKMMKEMNASRQIITGYLAYAAANDGSLMPGYDKSVQKVTLESGLTLTGEMACRYPWRLAPFLAGQVEEIYLVNDTKKTTDPMDHSGFDYQYRASLNPAIGINAYCVGGYSDGTKNATAQKDVVKRVGTAVSPSNLIVFASARMKTTASEDPVPGYFMVRPPKFWVMNWSLPFDKNQPGTNYGNVDPRWGGKALCTFLDGSVRLLGEDELVDMRHWSNAAADNNDKNFVVPK